MGMDSYSDELFLFHKSELSSCGSRGLSGRTSTTYAHTYTLERHLQSFENYFEYSHLCHSWETEKQNYRRELETIVNTFSEYSRHDANHSEKIIEYIERLLGEQRIRLLSPSDTWLILQCSYTHDLGMCVKKGEQEELFYNAISDPKKAMRILNDPNFQEYLKAVQNSPRSFPYSRGHDPDYEAVSFWRQFDDKNNDDAYFDAVFNSKFSMAQHYFSQIVMNYFRSKHANKSREELLRRLNENVEKDLIPAHMRIAVAEVDRCHNGGWDEVKKLKKRQNGYNRDYIHPAFVAALLRMGDLLDLDSTRFNPYQLKHLTHISRENAEYMLTNFAISEFLVDTAKICVTANFKSDMMQEILFRNPIHENSSSETEESSRKVQEMISSAAKIMRNWMEYIRINAQEFRHAWNDICPKDFPGCIAVPDKLRILVDGIELGESDFGLRYEISVKRSSQIIEGAGLYDSPLVFLREMLQNATDAAKIQIYRDLCGMISVDKVRELTYLDFLDKYANNFKEYAVTCSFSFQMVDKLPRYLCVTIEDKGIGITRKRLEKMKHIGSILDPALQDEIAGMPEWMKSTGNFGIGLQTAFLVSDRLHMETSPRENENGERYQRSILFNSTRLGGDITYFEKKITLLKPDGASSCGTKVTLKIDLLRRPRFLQQLFPSTDIDKGILLNLPYMIYKACNQYIRSISISEIVGIEMKFDQSFRIPGNVAPMKLLFDLSVNNFKNCVESLRKTELWVDPESGEIRYWYDGKIKNSMCCFLRYKKSKHDAFSLNRLYFRGIRFNERDSSYSKMGISRIFEIPGYDCDINIMCENAQDVLEINRDNVRVENISRLHKRLSQCFHSFLGSVIENAKMGHIPNLSQVITNELRKILTIYSLTINALVNRPKLPLADTIDSVMFDFSDVDENVKKVWLSILFPSPSNTLLKSSELWFTDMDGSGRNTKMRLLSSPHYYNLPDKVLAACNQYDILRNLHYSRLIVLVPETSKREEKQDLIKLYRLFAQKGELPSIDEYSYFLIVKNIIAICHERQEVSEIDASYFPAFPAFRPNSEETERINSLRVDAIPSCADESERDRYTQWLISPLPIDKLCVKRDKKTVFFWEDAMMSENDFRDLYNCKDYAGSYKALIDFLRISCVGQGEPFSDVSAYIGLYEFMNYLYITFRRFSDGKAK